jgi:hypothetical protein
MTDELESALSAPSERVSVRKFAMLAELSYPTALKYVRQGLVRSHPEGAAYKITMLEVRRFKEFGNLNPPEPPQPLLRGNLTLGVSIAEAHKTGRTND